MMKISKPVLTNDFLLSPVQFTSLNTILFKNVKNVYEGNEKIALEYEHPSKIEASSRDWVGIFPRGWTTLQQYVTFEWVSQSLPSGHSEQNKENGETIRRVIYFAPKYHIGSVNSSTFYQFVYISKQIEVLGVSAFFRFDTSCTLVTDSALELECLVPVSSKIRSTSVSDIGVLMANKISSSTSLDTRTLQTTSIHSLQNLDPEGKNWTKSHIPLTTSKAAFPKKSTGTGDALDPYSSHSEPVFPMSFPMGQCKKCFHFKRSGEFLRSQQVLQSKLKIVMERNKVLEERTQEMKKEMERLQTESKRLKTSFYNTNKEKVAYERFVKDFIKSLEKDSVVRVVNGNTEFLVKKVNYIGMEEHPRDKKTSKRERELKAVIGLQEITIRNLINSLQKKAKSVQELNQTVKLAQAFSGAREDGREFGSDNEEVLDEVSNSDVTSEYEFSLSKPQPPEEVAVDDTDTVLDDIRRTTEMELKDIGISRCLGKSSSRESRSEVELPNLSVSSYQSSSGGTRPKKPRLFDNVEDCWPFDKETPKIVQRKVIDPNTKFDEETTEESTAPNETFREDNPPGPTTNSDSDIDASEREGDQGISENYYDACEAFVPAPFSEDNPVPNENQQLVVFQDKNEEEKKEKENFLLTAIIPQELNVKPEKNVGTWFKNEDCPDKQSEGGKGKKFICKLSIDFGTKVRPSPLGVGDTGQPAIENGAPEPAQNGVGDSCELVPRGSQAVSDETQKPVLSVKKCNRSLEIQITQIDQKENPPKNYVQQKMIVKFGKDGQQETETGKTPTFEVNLAVSGVPKQMEQKEQIENAQEENLPGDTSPRTVWNDAADVVAEEVEEVREEPETAPDVNEDPSQSDATDMNVMDSLRYEKNLEFLQQKTEEQVKEEEEEEVSKEKPTAILIQNGQTKLALIRYQ